MRPTDGLGWITALKSVIPKVELTLRASIPASNDATFQAAAATAKANCPLSKVLNAEITLDAALV